MWVRIAIGRTSLDSAASVDAGVVLRRCGRGEDAREMTRCSRWLRNRCDLIGRPYAIVVICNKLRRLT